MRKLKFIRRIGKAAFEDVPNVSSATDMTGLMPVGVETGAEAEAYENLYPPRPKNILR